MHFGFNYLGGDLTKLVQEYRPSAFVTLDGGQARALVDMFPEALVIYRHWPDGDNLHEVYPNAASWYEAARAAVGHDNRIIIQGGNEPGGDFVNVVALAKWTCDLITAANADGGTVAVLGFSTCNPVPEMWRGPLLPVLKMVSDTRHYILSHEYFLFGSGQDDCIGVFWDAFTAADLEGIRRPQWIVGEYGYDLPGWKASQRDSGLLDEDYAERLVRAWNAEYAPAGVKAACIFAWGGYGGWQDYDVSDAGAFLTALKTSYLAEPSPLPDPPPTEPTEPEPGEDDMDANGRITALESIVAQLGARVTAIEAELAIDEPAEPPAPPDGELPNGHATGMLAFLNFEAGMMFWSAADPAIYVLYADDSGPRWERYADTWQEGIDPDRPALDEPPADYWRVPSRGFGKVWFEQPDVRLRLGWADAEYGPYFSGNIQFRPGSAVWVQWTEGRELHLMPDGDGWLIITPSPEG